MMTWRGWFDARTLADSAANYYSNLDKCSAVREAGYAASHAALVPYMWDACKEADFFWWFEWYWAYQRPREEGP